MLVIIPMPSVSTLKQNWSTHRMVRLHQSVPVYIISPVLSWLRGIFAIASQTFAKAIFGCTQIFIVILTLMAFARAVYTVVINNRLSYVIYMKTTRIRDKTEFILVMQCFLVHGIPWSRATCHLYFLKKHARLYNYFIPCVRWKK